MDTVKLRFSLPGTAQGEELSLDYAVIHAPTPRRRRETADTPIFNKLVEELGDAWAR